LVLLLTVRHILPQTEMEIRGWGEEKIVMEMEGLERNKEADI
jgi:hypothetical protein